MRTHSALVGFGLSISGLGYAVSPQVQALYEDCQDGDLQSCRQLFRLAKEACRQGDQAGCQFAENMNGAAQQERRLEQHGTPSKQTNSNNSKSDCLDSRMASKEQASSKCK